MLTLKVCISDGLWMHWCLWNWQLAHLERHHQCWMAYTGFRAMYDLIYKPFSGRTFQQNNTEPHTASVKQHGLWRQMSRCWTAVQIFQQLKTFEASWSENYYKEDPGLLSRREWENISLNIWCIFYVLLWIKYCFTRFAFSFYLHFTELPTVFFVCLFKYQQIDFLLIDPDTQSP